MSSNSSPRRGRTAAKFPATAKTPLAEAVAALMVGAAAVAVPPARAELPVPSALGLVAPGNGNVLPPVVNGNTMTIRQLSDRATLDWASFNIGEGNVVNFRQPSTTSIALNNIFDSRPSQILGSLTANGQVYLVNGNGFFFGPNARVDTNSLVVSTLRISKDAMDRGLSKVIEIDGRPALEKDPALTGQSEVYRQDENGQWVKRSIGIAEGAQLKAQAGGRIMIFAPSVENKGSIQTPDGQTVVAAASDKVYLQEADSGETGVRGLLVEVATGGDVANVGRIAARRGNVTLAGFAVNQQGLVSATTSVNLNGSIRLLAREKGNNPVVQEGSKFVLRPDSTGRTEDKGDGLGKSARTVLGARSTTEVRLEAGSGETAVDGQAQAPSQIEIMGKQVLFGESARVKAPSGKISVAATANPQTPDARVADPDASLELKPGATIDASGVRDVKVPVSRNVVEVELRGFELRDAPLQKDRNGPLYGKKVLVDIRKSENGRIPLADISGSINRIERSVEERSIQGGSIDLTSSGTTLIGRNATVDVSGGSIAWQEALVKTTWLQADGRFFEISDADPNRRYDGIFGEVTRYSKEFNITDTWSVPGPAAGGRFERGYVEGAGGGKIGLRTDFLQLDGNLRGQNVDGPFQRETAQRADPSTLDIELGYSLQNAQSIALLAEARNAADQIKGLTERFTSLFQNPLAVADRYLERTGFGRVHLASRGVVAVAEGADLRVPGGGSLELEGQKLDVAGRIAAPAGSVTLHTRFDQGTSAPGLDGSIRLAETSKIDVSGLWTNDLEVRNSHRGGPPPGLALVDGGSTSVVADGNLSVAAGAEIAADGGAWLNAQGRLAEGKGGAITLTAQRGSNAISGLDSANLELAGNLHAYALSQGGSLSLTSNEILVGESFALPFTQDARLDPLVLGAGFFNEGGFADYNLKSNLYGVAVGYDTTVQLQSRNLVLRNGYQSAPTGSSLRGLTDIALLPDDRRQATNLSLSLAQAVEPPGMDRTVRLDAGSKILGDPGAKVTLSADSQVRIDGTILAPAGIITARIDAPEGGIAYIPSQGIFVGPEGRLLAPGTALNTPGGRSDLRDDRVLGGGEIHVEANRGYIGLGQGSVLDVSGSSAVVDTLVPTAGEPGFRPVPDHRAAPAGSIFLAAPEAILADGSLSGFGNRDRGAEGGSLSVTLKRELRGVVDENVLASFPNTPRAIEVRQGSAAGDGRDFDFGAALPSGLNGLAQISAAGIEAGGFDSLTLATEPVAGDQVRFVNDVSLKTGRRIVLDTPTVALAQEKGQAASSVQLDSLYLALGAASVVSARPPSAAGTGGPGSFTAAARDIELAGSLRLDGAGATRLAANQDIRLRGVNVSSANDFKGELQAYGNLTLAAQQIYPATLSQFDIKVSGGDDARLTVLGGKNPRPVLSAGGILNVEAPNIDVAGNIQAPFGTVKLTATAGDLNVAAGANVSVSARGKTVPFGINQGGIDWLYPLPSQIKLLFGLNDGELLPPTGAVDLKGPRVTVAEGATVDLSGGGQLYSREFLKTIGGSVDLLDPLDPLVVSGEFAYQEKYAILPWLKDRLAPYDPLEMPKSGLVPGDAVYLADGAAGLAAGKYTLLPAAYALLPGAYLVTPESAFVNSQPGQVSVRSDGVAVVAGRRTIAGSNYRDFGWEGYAVETGTEFRTRTAYAEYRADTYFAKKAAALEQPVPYLPRDAATMHIEAGRQLSLEGTVKSRPAAGGAGGRVDVAADRLRIVGAGGNSAPAAGEVVLRADQLNDLNVESLLLGGRRFEDSKGQRVAVGTASIAVDSGAGLKAPELMLAATDRIDVKSGARLEASGKLNSSVDSLRLADTAGTRSDSAFLRVASGGPLDLIRDQAVSGAGGVLSVEAGAALAAGGAIALDASGDARLAGSIDLQGGSLWLGASLLNLGDVPAGAAGLSLTDEQLAALRMDELVLRSNGEIRSYGAYSVTAKQLNIQASGIVNAGAGANATFSADSIQLANAASTAPGAAGGSGGSLAFKAKEFRFGGGRVSLAGFDAVAIDASERVLAEGAGQLAASGDLAVSTPVLTAGNGADFALEAPGRALTVTGAPADGAAAGGLGGRIALAGGTVSLGTSVLLPSGVLAATAEQGLFLGGTANLNLAGVTRNFAGKDVRTPGGRVSLASLRGNLDLAAGSRINVSGVEEAGRLELSAPEGTASLGAAFFGGGAKGAELAFDVGSLADGGAAAFAYLNAGGNARGFSLRLHDGDLAVGAGQVLRAGRINLSTDRGGLNVAGTLDASGATAGSIELSAGDRVQLASTARLSAGTATANGKGGRAFLNSIDQDGDGVGGVQVDAGAVIDVRGGRRNDPAATPDADQVRYLADGPFVKEADGSEYLAGDVHLRGLRDSQGNGSNQLGIDFRGSAVGAEAVLAEGVKAVSAASIGATEIAAWQAETRTYMNGQAGVARPGLTLVPGLEIRSAGDLALAEDWSFASGWRYGPGNDLPGFLTVRAGGDLNLAGRLSDGLAPGELTDGQGSVAALPDLIQSGRSWSFRLAAGSDPSAANPLAVRTGSGDLNLADKAAVRTGTGDIAIRAGGDLRLAGADSAIYTVGRLQAGSAGRFGAYSDFDAFWNFYAEYPTGGGDIDIAAGGNIVGAKTSQFVPDWLVRTGRAAGTGEPVAWGIAITQRDEAQGAPAYDIPLAVRGFKQNVGALAGGDIRIAAGGSVTDLSAVIPTVGKSTSTTRNRIEVHGGGNLQLSAGGGIAGGMFYVEKGSADIRSDGAIAGGSQFTAGPVFSLGDATVSVRARTGLDVGTVYNPFLLKERNVTGTDPLFATYSDASRVGFQSLAGDIRLRNDFNVIDREYRDLATGGSVLDVLAGPRNYAQLFYYPGTLETVAAAGSIVLERSLATAPSARGNLLMFAANSIGTGTVDQSVYLNVSDADPVRVPSALAPQEDLGNFNDSLNPEQPPEFVHGPVPTHSGDSEPVRIATLEGDIEGPGGVLNLSLYLPKQGRISAGQDLRDVNLEIQNLTPADTTRISAGRDLVFSVRRNSAGDLLDGKNQRVRVAGPGNVQVAAGRNIDLGSSDGIVSIGNTRNPALPLAGSSLTLVAGARDADTAAVLKTYGGLSDQDIADLSAEERLNKALPLVFEELQKAGIKAAKTGRTRDYDPGYEAIAALFPAEDADGQKIAYAGDINLFFSRTQTVAGGDINLLAPGGTVNAGLSSTSLGSKSSSDLGIVVQQQGAINSLVKEDFTVNESRVFALGGGDITIWSSDADIDAGRGAKSALSVPPPETSYDSQGNLVVVFPPAVAGSGIQTASSDPKVPAGNAYLFAPRGIVDAGDAGISIGGSLTIGATAVLGAGNISVGGASVGVPAAPPPPVVPAAAAAAGAAAAKQSAGTQTAEKAPDKDESVAEKTREMVSAALRNIQVDLVGFGECSVGDIRNGREGCGG